MQDTKDLTLPKSGTAVIIRAYITGRVDQEVERIRLLGNKTRLEKSVTDPNDPNALANAAQNTEPDNVIVDIDPTADLDAENKLIELMVLSVAGATENVLDLILDLPKEDVDYLKAEIKSVEDASSVSEEEKKSRKGLLFISDQQGRISRPTI